MIMIIQQEHGAQSAEPTNMLRWYATYDLDNIHAMRLQQMWVITTYGLDNVPVRQEREWRFLEVHNADLEDEANQ